MNEQPGSQQLPGSGSISDRVYVWLRQRILTGDIKPGELIDEKNIGARFSVSRTPVREAVKRLSDEHLVDVVAQSATRAATLDKHAIHEAYLIRRALEMESAGQAAKAMSQQHTDALADIIERHVRTIAQKKYVKALEIDDEFHAYIAGISGLHRLWRTVEISKAQLDRCRHIMLPKFGEAETTIEQHRLVLRALNTNEEERSRNAMRDHLDIAYRSTRTMLNELLSEPELSSPQTRKSGGRSRKS
jgi:DNA-binding GntR family transcriptional regulator